MTTQKLLIIDDEPNLLYSLTKALQGESLSILTAQTAAQGLQMVRSEEPQAVILDVRLPDGYGLNVYDEIRAINSRIPVIIITAFSSMDVAVESMKRGAYEYLLKPIELETLREHVEQALEISRSNDSGILIEPTPEMEAPAPQIVGDSQAMQEVFKAIGRVAQQEITVLIQGESGSGKELVAEAIYKHSARADEPFMPINCAAIAETLLESELFGHERGAFTGAERSRVGKFEEVDGGTLFLDEIGDMSSATQAKVLRLLQDGSYQRVGSNQVRRSNVRIIAATNRDLEAMVSNGTFREDLYYRLRGFMIHVPPLRERLEDVQPLMTHFIRHYNRELGRQVRIVTPEAMRCLERYRWPGNVRELQIVVKYAILHAIGDTITSASLPESLHAPFGQLGHLTNVESQLAIAGMIAEQLTHNQHNLYRDIHSTVDRILLQEVLDYVDGNQVQAAHILGISRTTLRNRLREVEISSDPLACPDSEQRG